MVENDPGVRQAAINILQSQGFSVNDDEVTDLINTAIQSLRNSGYDNVDAGTLILTINTARTVEEDQPQQQEEEQYAVGPPEYRQEEYEPDASTNDPSYEDETPPDTPQTDYYESAAMGSPPQQDYYDEPAAAGSPPPQEDPYHEDPNQIVFFSRHAVTPEMGAQMDLVKTNTIDTRVEAERDLASMFKQTPSAGGVGNLVPKKGRNPASPRSRRRRDREIPSGDTAFEEVEDDVGDRSDALKKDEKLAQKQKNKPLKYKAVASFVRRCYKEVVRDILVPLGEMPSLRNEIVANAVLRRMDYYLDYYRRFREETPGDELFNRDTIWMYLAKRTRSEGSNKKRTTARLTAGRVAAQLWLPRIKGVETLAGASSYPLDPLLQGVAEGNVPYETDALLLKFRDAVVKFLSIAPTNVRLVNGVIRYKLPKLTRGKYPKRGRVAVDGVGFRMTPKGADEDGRRCDEGTKIYGELCATEKALKRIDRARQMAAVARGFQRKVELATRERDKFTYGNRVKGFEYYAGIDTIASIRKNLKPNKPGDDGPNKSKISKLPVLQGDDDPMTAPVLRDYGRHRDDVNSEVQQFADAVGYVRIPGTGSSVKRNACSEFLDAYRLTRKFEFTPTPPLMFVETDTGNAVSPDDALYLVTNTEVLRAARESGADPRLLLSVVPHPCRVCEEQSYSYLVGTHRMTPNRLSLGPYGRLFWFAHFYPDPHSEAAPALGGKDLYDEVTKEDAKKGQAHMELAAASKHFDAPLPVESDYASVAMPFSVEFETDVGKAFRAIEEELTGPAFPPSFDTPQDRGVFEVRIGWVPSPAEMQDPEVAKKMTSRDVAAHRLLKAYRQLVPENVRIANYRRMYGESADVSDVTDDVLERKIRALFDFGMFRPVQLNGLSGTYKSLRLANADVLATRDVLIHVPVDYFYPPQTPRKQVVSKSAYLPTLPEYTDENTESQGILYDVLNLLAYDYGLLPEFEETMAPYVKDRRVMFRLPKSMIPEDFDPNRSETYANLDYLVEVDYAPYIQEHLIYIDNRFYYDDDDGNGYYYAPVLRAMSTGVELAKNDVKKVFYRFGQPDPEFGFPRPGSKRCDLRYPMYMLETKKSFMERKEILARLRENVDHIAQRVASGTLPEDEKPEQYRWWNKGPRLDQRAWDQRGPESGRVAAPASDKKIILGSLAADVIRGLGVRSLTPAAKAVIEYALVVKFKAVEGADLPTKEQCRQKFESDPGGATWDAVEKLVDDLYDEHVKSRNVGVSVDPRGYWPTASRKIFPAPNNSKPLDYERAEFEAYRDAFRNLYRAYYYLAAIQDGDDANRLTILNDEERKKVVSQRADAVLRYLIALRCRMHALYQLAAPLKGVKFFERFPESLLVGPDEASGGGGPLPRHLQRLDRTEKQRYVAKDARSDGQNPRVDPWWRYLSPMDLGIVSAEVAKQNKRFPASSIGSSLWTRQVYESTTNKQLRSLVERDYAKHKDQLLPWIDEDRFPVRTDARPYAVYEPMGPLVVDAWFGCVPLDALTVARVADGDLENTNNDKRTMELMAMGPEIMMYACFDGATHIPGQEYARNEVVRLSKPAYFAKTSAVYDLNPLRDPVSSAADDPMAAAGFYESLDKAVVTLGIEYF